MQPKLKANELVERVNAFRNSSEKNDLTRQTLYRDINKLKKTDPGPAFAVSGLMTSIEHKEVETRDIFQTAININPHDRVIRLNYSVALDYLGYYSEAKEVVKGLYKNDPRNMVLLDRLIGSNFQAMRVQEAWTLLQDWEKFKKDEEHSLSDAINEFREFYKKHDIQDDLIETFMNHTIDLLHENGFYHSMKILSIKGDEDSEWLSCTFLLEESVDTVVDMNMKLADSMVDVGIPPKVSSLVNFMFLPANN